jgi:hypothetical protein
MISPLATGRGVVLRRSACHNRLDKVLMRVSARDRPRCWIVLQLFTCEQDRSHEGWVVSPILTADTESLLSVKDKGEAHETIFVADMPRAAQETPAYDAPAGTQRTTR